MEEIKGRETEREQKRETREGDTGGGGEGCPHVLYPSQQTSSATRRSNALSLSDLISSPPLVFLPPLNVPVALFPLFVICLLLHQGGSATHTLRQPGGREARPGEVARGARGRRGWCTAVNVLGGPNCAIYQT